MKIITKALKSLKDKYNKERNEKLLSEYEKGRILKVDDGTDNKKFLKNK